jgi:hypothetical protein
MLTFCFWSSAFVLLVCGASLADQVRYRFFVNRRLRRNGFEIRPGSWSGFVDGVGLLAVLHCVRRGRNYLVWVRTRRFFPAKVVLKLQRDPSRDGAG